MGAALVELLEAIASVWWVVLLILGIIVASAYLN